MWFETEKDFLKQKNVEMTKKYFWNWHKFFLTNPQIFFLNLTKKNVEIDKNVETGKIFFETDKKNNFFETLFEKIKMAQIFFSFF